MRPNQRRKPRLQLPQRSRRRKKTKGSGTKAQLKLCSKCINSGTSDYQLSLLQPVLSSRVRQSILVCAALLSFSPRSGCLSTAVFSPLCCARSTTGNAPLSTLNVDCQRLANHKYTVPVLNAPNPLAQILRLPLSNESLHERAAHAFRHHSRVMRPLAVVAQWQRENHAEQSTFEFLACFVIY